MTTQESVRPSTSEVMCVDGTELTVRPIEIDDVERLERMFGRLSPESVYFRFFSPIPRLSPSTLLRLADVDHWRRDALVALDGDEIVAVARYSEVASSGRSGGREAEVALTVEDRWQRRGIGRRLVRRLGALAAARGYHAFAARILPGNRASLALIRRLVPDASVKFVDGDYEARLSLDSFASVSAERCLCAVETGAGLRTETRQTEREGELLRCNRSRPPLSEQTFVASVAERDGRHPCGVAAAPKGRIRQNRHVRDRLRPTDVAAR